MKIIKLCSVYSDIIQILSVFINIFEISQNFNSTLTRVQFGFLMILMFIKGIELAFKINKDQQRIGLDSQVIIAMILFTISNYETYFSPSFMNLLQKDNETRTKDKFEIQTYLQTMIQMNLFILNQIPSLMLSLSFGIIQFLNFDINMQQILVNITLMIVLHIQYLQIDYRMLQLESYLYRKDNICNMFLTNLKFSFQTMRQSLNEIDLNSNHSRSNVSQDKSISVHIDTSRKESERINNNRLNLTNNTELSKLKQVDKSISIGSIKQDKLDNESRNKNLKFADISGRKSSKEMTNRNDEDNSRVRLDISKDNSMYKPNDVSNKRIHDFKTLIESEIDDIEELVHTLSANMITDLNQYTPHKNICFKKNSIVDELITSFRCTHYKNIEIYKINLLIRISEGMKCSFEINKSLVKLIVNTFIENAIYHSNMGTIVVHFKKFSIDQMHQFNEFQMVGEITDVDSYLCISVMDNGSDKFTNQDQLFDLNSQEVDINSENRKDLMLNLCAVIAKSIDCIILYHSCNGISTNFTLCIPNLNPNSKPSKLISDQYRTFIELAYNFQKPVRQVEHKCNCVLTVDSSQDSLLKYNLLQNNQIPHKHFTTGKICLKNINQQLQNLCPKCPRFIIIVGEVNDMDVIEMLKIIRVLDVDNRVRVELNGFRNMNQDVFDGQCDVLNEEKLNEQQMWICKANEEQVQNQEIKQLGLMFEEVHQDGEEHEENQKPIGKDFKSIEINNRFKEIKKAKERQNSEEQHLFF